MELTKKKSSKYNINDFIKTWNIKYPYDRWWRKKYNIAFGSQLHKEQSHVDMAIEFKEDLYFKLLKDRSVAEEFKTEDNSLISVITARKHLELAKGTNVTEEDFDSLDLSQFNDK